MADSADDLFGLPLDEFTAARNALAKALKAAGDPTADEVKALAKPSLPAWAINQLARRSPQAIDTLLDAGERLRKAQSEALGGGDPAQLRAALGAEREAVAQLTSEAELILRDGGHTVSAATQSRIADTLRAAAVDDDARELLAAGRLSGDLEPGGGFDLLAAMAPAAAERAAERAQGDELQRRRRLREARNRVEELRRAAKAAAREADRAEATARRARAEAEARGRELAEAEQAAADLDRRARDP
jgi:hypothetical protein